MNYIQLIGGVVTAAVLLGANVVLASTTTPSSAAAAIERAPEAVKDGVLPAAHPKVKAHAKGSGKLIDINGANKATLLKLPGITDADADKIIANRPYGSKTWLVTNKVLGETAFYAIQSLIVAKQPFKSAAENVAYFQKLEKQRSEKP